MIPKPYSPQLNSAISPLRVQLPELYALKSVEERNDWHQDDAFRQSLRLWQWVTRLPASLLELGIAIDKQYLAELLGRPVKAGSGKYTVQELLKFAALIHDIGKKETFVRNADGTTRCPGHEAAGARRVPAICARFDLNLVETAFITTLVRNHGEPYALFKEVTGHSPATQQARLNRFEAEHASYLLPLLLLACGDMVTSHLPTNRPQKYRTLLSFYQQWLYNCPRYLTGFVKPQAKQQ